MTLARFEARFSLLDDIPESLFSAVATHPHGHLLDRAEGVLQWRSALLEGRMPAPDELVWPAARLRRTILMRLEALDIVRYCRDEPDLTDSVLESILEGVASAEDYFRKAGEFDDRLAQRQKMRDRDSDFADEEGIADHAGSAGDAHRAGTDVGAEPAAEDNGEGATVEADPAQAAIAGRDPGNDIPGIGEEAAMDAPVPGAIDPLTETLDRRWGALSLGWKALSGVLDELGAHLGRGWDLTQGVLSTQGWRDIVRYRRLLRDLPELTRLVEALGRMRGEGGDDAEGSLAEEIVDPMRREPEQTPRRLADHAIDATEGVRLSDDIARMLPVESALLGHPALNLLWHARRAENMLRCYQLQGVLSEHSPQPDPEPESPRAEAPEDPGHGPIIVCLDSSASMAGEPETIARAITLEALRLAAAEGRDCLVIAFSGEGQMMRWRPDFSRRGYRDLLGFLRQRFHGGTDVASALRAAIEQLDEDGWRQADILVISDGRFPLPDDLLPEIATARKKRDVRIHGLLIGRWRSRAMEAVCDPLHRFDVWAG